MLLQRKYQIQRKTTTPIYSINPTACSSLEILRNEQYIKKTRMEEDQPSTDKDERNSANNTSDTPFITPKKFSKNFQKLIREKLKRHLPFKKPISSH